MVKEYYELYTFWMSNLKKMFIKDEQFNHLLKIKYENILKKELTHNNYYIKDNVLLVAKIILNDQISRNIYYNQKDLLKIYSTNSLKYIEVNQIKKNIEIFNPIERSLLLLPYAHTFEYEKLILIINLSKKWLKECKDKEDIQIYERFTKARCQKILEHYNQPILLNKDFSTYDQDTIDKKIYDKNSIQVTNKIGEILNKDKIYDLFCTSMKNISIQNKTLTLSLSSGVDSNVLLILLSHYIQKNKVICKLNCLIVYYKNRENQFEEIKIAQNICSQLKIPLYCRTIDEIQRNTLTDRNFYEKYTKDCKYKCYEQLGQISFLGHHKDDIFENIINNIKKQIHYNQLNGMEILQDYKTIQIARPMLNLTKEDILNFAHMYDIPYVYDSTPKSSERGRIRDTILPVIKEYDIQLYEGFFKMTENFNEIYKIYEQIIPPLNKNEENNYTLINQHITFFDYWKKVFSQICNRENIDNISNKSIQHFLVMLNKNIQKNNQHTKFILNPKLSIVYKKTYFEFFTYS